MATLGTEADATRVPTVWRTPEDKPTGFMNITSDMAAETIHDRMMKPGAITPTGLPTIDKNVFLWGDRKGIPQGSYVLIGAASNVGKTLFGLHMLKSAAKSGQRAALISLDMKNRDAIARMQQSIAKEIPFSSWLPSKWNENNLELLKGALREWGSKIPGQMAIHMDRNRSLDSVVAKIYEGYESGATFFVVDHFQKIRVEGLRNDVYSQADRISETMDDLVDELDVTIVGLSQLNRTASREVDRKPSMFDLHGGTSMESNSAIVLMLDHSRYEVDRNQHHLIRGWMILAKNQIGPKNIEFPVLWDASDVSVREGLPDEQYLWPQSKANGR